MSKFEIKRSKLISCISIAIIIICFCINSISYAATTLSDAYDKVKKSKSPQKWEIVYAEDGGNGTGADGFDSKGWYLIIYIDWTSDADQATKIFKYVKTKSSKKIGENVYDLYAGNADSGHYDLSLDNCGFKGKIQNAKVPTTAYLKDKSKIYTIDDYSELDATGKKSTDEAVGNKEKPETAKTTVIDKSAIKPEWGDPVSTKFTYNNDGKYYDKYIDSDGNIWLVPNDEEVSTKDEIYQEEDIEQKNDDDPFSNVIDGLAGLLLYPIKVIPLLIGKAMSLLMAAFAGSKAGALDVEDILFNKVELTDINFFDLNPSDATVKTIRLSVAAWYYSVRNVAIVALLVICIYVGIRMAIATVAEEKAKYKEMLIDWATGLALVFVLHYIMIFIININNALVDIFAKGLDADSGDVMEKFFTQAWQVGFTNGFISAVCYVTLVGITFVFLLSYIKRMITIGFLIVIAPLVTVTYSLDKMGDSKSQALNTWFKEFSYNILIQPFQCVAYLALANTSYQLLAQSNSEHLDEMFRSAVLAFVMLLFVLESEKIIKHIFHFESETMSDGLKEAAVGAAILGESRKAIANRSKNQGGQPSPSGSGEGSSEEAEARKKMAQNEIKYSSANANNVNSGDFSNSGTDASTNSRRNGSSNSNTTVSQNDNNSSKNKPSARQRMAREGANVFGTVGGNRYVRGYANFVKKASAAMLGGALITGMTGDAKTGTLAGIESWRTASKTPTKAGTAITKQSHKNQLAKSYNNYVNQYAEEHSGEGLTQQQINDAARQHAIDLMNADSEDSLSGSDREFKHALENVYADAGGATVKDNYMRLNQTLNDIEDGKIGETTIQKKFKGKINAGQAKKAKKAQEEQVVDDSDTFRMNFTEYDKNHPNNSNNA